MPIHTLKKMVGALVLAVSAATVALYAQTPQQEQREMPATKVGWWVRVDTQKTEASSVTLQVGTKASDRRSWRAWHSGDGYEFDAPRDFQAVKELYVNALVNPEGKKVRMCVFFQNYGVKQLDFSGAHEEQFKQTDRDESCK
jgi:hypothetical protein